ncbi:DUF4192 domain-containing protein [uncultured Arthrobacter sp.]|uniref:DUF4192 domain-containing protein n=1 Tax=uncultured Arthrobacter sp. TaxID=114050 RepID=UPI0026119F5F|nr:DUF4192 domain-containing protein [uncultured Arthrobacter sp.]
MTSPHPAPGRPLPPTLSITSPEDILVYVPHALGFTPQESLVVLTTANGRLGATLRVDLPAEGADPLEFVQGVLSFLLGDTEADATLVIVYTGHPWPRLSPPVFDELVAHLEAVLAAAGMPVRAGWLASPAHWRDYFCRDERCCPWPGAPLDDLTHSLLGAELVFAGSSFDASAPAAVLRGAPELTRADPVAVEAGDVEDARVHYASRCEGRWDTPEQFAATSAAWDAVVGGPEPLRTDTEAQLTGFLLASIESRTVRDFLLVSACLGSAAALAGARACGLLVGGPRPRPGVADADADAVVVDVGAPRRAVGTAAPAGAAPAAPAGGPGPEFLYAEVLAGRYAGPILWARVDAMASLLARLAVVSSGESRAAALTMAAWFDYARGRGSRAAVLLDAAQEAVPGYRLARLLDELLRRGGLPVWARSRSTAWSPGGGRLGEGCP